MIFIDFLLKIFEKDESKEALIWQGKSYDYGWLWQKVFFWQEFLQEKGIASGTVVMLEADFSPQAVACLLALLEQRCIVVPFSGSLAAKKSEFSEIAQPEVSLFLDQDDNINFTAQPAADSHRFYQQLRDINHPGLVLFSSGSTGKSKAAVHDFKPLLEKFKIPRRRLRTVSFLLYDHIGGINTLFYTLSNAGCLVILRERTPDAVLGAVEEYKVELLPTTPTFINLVILSEAYKRYNLQSLKIVTYGTEPMLASTLRRFHELFPTIQLQQTYGLSEVGILRSKSKEADSLWVKVGGEGFQVRIVDDVMQIKAQSAMLGYLNASSPFTEDGWLDTGDYVERDGEYIRILGRRSEIINVGGQKVYPAEVESVIQQMSGVCETLVYGERNPILGNIVCAKAVLSVPRDARQFAQELKRYCRQKLENYKVPVKVLVVDQIANRRFKKCRRNEDNRNN